MLVLSVINSLFLCTALEIKIIAMNNYQHSVIIVWKLLVVMKMIQWFPCTQFNNYDNKNNVTKNYWFKKRFHTCVFSKIVAHEKKNLLIYGIYKNVLNSSPFLLQHLLHQGKFLFCPTKTVWSLTGFLQRVMKCRPNQSSINCPGAAPTASPTIVKV